MLKMVIFHSYVSLPEGTGYGTFGFRFDHAPYTVFWSWLELCYHHFFSWYVLLLDIAAVSNKEKSSTICFTNRPLTLAVKKVQGRPFCAYVNFRWFLSVQTLFTGRAHHEFWLVSFHHPQKAIWSFETFVKCKYPHVYWLCLMLLHDLLWKIFGFIHHFSSTKTNPCLQTKTI